MALVGRIIGWILLISGLPVFATDALLWSESGQWVPLSGLDLWYNFAPSSINEVRTLIAKRLSPYLWDPTLVSILTLPAFLVLMGVGFVLMLLFLQDTKSVPKMERAVVALVHRITVSMVLVGAVPVFVVTRCARILGWILSLGAVPVLTADAFFWAQSGHWNPVTLLDLLAPSTIHTARDMVGFYTHPYVWDPVIVTLLGSPLCLILTGSGLLLTALFRKRDHLIPKIAVPRAASLPAGVVIPYR